MKETFCNVLPVLLFTLSVPLIALFFRANDQMQNSDDFAETGVYYAQKCNRTGIKEINLILPQHVSWFWLTSNTNLHDRRKSLHCIQLPFILWWTKPAIQRPTKVNSFFYLFSWKCRPQCFYIVKQKFSSVEKFKYEISLCELRKRKSSQTKQKKIKNCLCSRIL